MGILNTVRVRLVAVLFCAAVPVTFLAVSIAWQNYRMVTHEGDRRVLVAAQSIAASYLTVLDDVRRWLTLVSTNVAKVLPAGSADRPAQSSECNAALARLLDNHSDRLESLLLLSADGQMLCSAPLRRDADKPSSASVQNWFKGGSPAISDFMSVSDTARVLTVSIPILVDNRPTAVLTAIFRSGWFAQLPRTAPGTVPVDAWIVDSSRNLIPVRNANPQALPAPGELDRILESSTPGIATAAGNDTEDYVSVPLDSGFRILAGTDSRSDMARGREVFIRQLAEVMFLLLLGLTLVSAGASYAVSAPLKRLSASVRRWRDGGPFTPEVSANTPLEIAELATSFDQAIQRLNERERQLVEAKAQQELLMQEIHHRVKNNLQIIASLLNLQANRIRQPEARAEFQSARDRIRALATLHRHLYAHNEIHSIEMSSFLQELCQQLLQTMGEPRLPSAAPGRIGLTIDASKVTVSSDQAVPMALIVTEAVSNAAKYAFPGGRSGTIAVRLTDDDGIIRLTIQDDGIGMPAGQTETETGIRDGLGLQLIRGFARQLGATLTVIEDKGTRYEIELKSKPGTAEAATEAA